MKNFLTTAALGLSSLLLPAAARAQLGVKIGPSLAVLNGRVGQDASYQLGLNAGAFYEFRLNGPLSIQPEAMYSLQGGGLSNAFTDYKTRLHYFAVPVLARLRLGPVFVEGGPQFGVLVAASEDGRVQLTPASGQTPPTIGNSNPDAASNYRSTEFALCAGAGLNLGDNFRLGGRFVAGLNDINNVSSLSGVNDPRLQNRVFQLYVAAQLSR